MATRKRTQKPSLIVRNATIEDIPGIQDLSARVYPHDGPYSKDMLRGQLNAFPEGQYVAVYQDKVVGYCATFIIDEESAFKPHTWREITGRGFASQHNPKGDFLYGMDVFVDPEVRGIRIGQRLYNQRKALCKHLRLKGIVFGARMPGYFRRRNVASTPEEYVQMVIDKKFRDPVLSFQMRNGFEFVRVMSNYLIMDKDSMSYAALMVWRNPEMDQTRAKNEKGYQPKLINSVRVGTVQYLQRRVNSFEEFAQIVEYFVDVVADYQGDFVVFPEMFTLQLLSIATHPNKPMSTQQSIKELTKYTDRLKKMFNKLALRYNINIIGGSHPVRDENGRIMNICYIYLRDGSIYEQAKIHATPNERYWWNMEGGDSLSVIQTDCGPIGVLICYDSEFPELARYLVDQGAKILFVPFCTDERQSYLRVRYCCQARAVENQCYVVMSGNVGNLPGVGNMDIQYAQSCILTPCDFPFARDGIAADTTPNVEMVAFADLKLDDLQSARNSGTVQNLKDRRFDLYSLEWLKKD